MRAFRRAVVAAAFGASVSGCGSQQCAEVSAYPADEARACVGAAQTIPELQACSSVPATRGVRIVCLVDSSGQLFVATTGDSATLSGTGWRYSGGAGEQQLSTSEQQRCTDFVSEVGFPEPSKQCSP
jgi:hypothetical protein